MTKGYKLGVITLAKNLGKGSYPTETQNEEQAVNWKSGNNTNKPLGSYMREHDSFVNEIIYCHSRGLALLTQDVLSSLKCN